LKTVGVRFKKAYRVYTFEAAEVECALGDWVVVETERGMALGQISSPPREVPEPPPQPYKKVLRRAEDRDILRYDQNCELEGYAHQFCVELIRGKGLPMKLVDVEYLFDGSKAIFYFTAEGRVDFRDLVRDLARQFHTRIEMRQIGVRDEAKLVGGVGGCGRERCCATWLTDFAPISVRMAKDQNVSLNPGKISGICGRLMCCLSYEHQMYRKLGQEMPKLGKRVETSRGAGKVIRRNVLDGTFVFVGPQGEVEMTVDEFHGRAPAPEPEAAPTAVESAAEGRTRDRSRPPRRPRERGPGPAPQGGGERREAPSEGAPPGGELPPAQEVGAQPEGGQGPRPQGSRRRRSRRKRKANPSPERKSDG